MITKLRRRLTTLYAIVFGGFLFAFSVLVGAGAIWSVYTERVEEIRLLADQVAREQHSEIVEHYKQPSLSPEERTIEENYDITGEVFYYILDDNQRIIKVDQPVPALRNEVYANIANWNPGETKKFLTISLSDGKRATVLLAAHKVISHGEVIATVYVGRDVTAYIRVLIRLVFILILAAGVFILLAALVGSMLAGRVIRPMEESLERQKQFVADASHELRTPLSILLTSIEAIEMDEENKLSSFSGQIIQDVKEEVYRIKRLISQLLVLARADAGDGTLARKTFALDLVANQVLQSLRPAAEQKDIDLTLTIREPFQMAGDSERIHQLLYILVDNGIKYTPAGGTVAVRVDKTTANGVCYSRIIVADNGPGVPAEYRERIFERFFRADKARTRNIEGSGLGLSIAKWIVDTHHGRIYVRSGQGKGSHFVVLIPGC